MRPCVVAPRIGWFLLALVGAATAIGGLRLLSDDGTEELSEARSEGEPGAPSPEPANPPELLDPIRWLAIGGGEDPASNQVSLEQDLRLAQEVFGANGAVLFAGGSERRHVQVADASQPLSLRSQLGDFFDPRPSRPSEYRRTELGSIFDARPSTVEAMLERALSAADTPLLLFFAGHGAPQSDRLDVEFLTWGGYSLQVRDLIERLEPAERPVRVVVASCFSGGFAELAFAGGIPGRPVTGDVCGLFSTSWDREASGCDPNPDRGSQEGYNLHFLYALRGQDRAGEPADVDLDADGQVSLL
ncbi:MAG: hypothetical protein AAGF12_42145, partial [Myxococcota bacterium]